MKNIILIDLGNTLIYNKKIDFEKGFKYIYSILKIDTMDEKAFLQKAVDMTHKILKIRDSDIIEMPFTNILKKIFEELEIFSNLSMEIIEKEFYKNAIIDEIIPGVIDFLSFLKKNGCLVYIISNSTFSSQCLKLTINNFGIDKYINGIYSSADTNYRKPSRLFFDKINELSKINKSQVLMIGNDDYYDFEFAKNIGIDFLWFNEKRNINNKNCYEFNKYEELIKKWGEKID